MKFEHLEYFCSIVPGFSLNKLSEQMHISPQTLNASIKILETELGYKLLDRTSKGVFFTKEGESFFRYTKEYLDNLHTLQVQTLPVQGKLVIPVMQNVIPGFIDVATELYLKENPNVDLEFRYNSSVIQSAKYLEDGTAEMVFFAMSECEDSYIIPKNALLSFMEKNNYSFTSCMTATIAVELHKKLLAKLKSVSLKNLSPYECVIFSCDAINSQDTNDVQQLLDVCSCTSKIMYEYNRSVYRSRLCTGRSFGLSHYSELEPLKDIVQVFPEEKITISIGYMSKVGHEFSPPAKRFIETVQRIQQR